MIDRTPHRLDSPRRRSGSVRPSSARRTPAPPIGAVLALLLGVSAAVWCAGRATPPTFAIGAAAALRPAPSNGAAREALPRADRGERRTAQNGGSPTDRSASPGRTRPPAVGPIAAPARSLVPMARTTAPTRPSPDPAGGRGSGPAGTFGAEVLRLTNIERAKVDCGALHADSRLAAAAQAHSTDMATRNYFSHTSPDGVTPWDRARAAGYASPSAENIAMGFRTPADVMAAWMQSSGHRANILNCASHAVGVGFDARGYYWTQLFGYV